MDIVDNVPRSPEDEMCRCNWTCGWERNIRYSLRELEQWAKDGHRKPLEDLFRAFRGIQELHVGDPNSFWVIAGYHGIPLAPFDPDQSSLAPPFAWWGGYCHHGNCLFPTWHRAYVQHLENALRTQVPDVSLAYWDEGSQASLKGGLPACLTDEFVELDGNTKVKNPLRRFTFPVDIGSSAQYQTPDGSPVADFSKRAKTHTVRCPLSAFHASMVRDVADKGQEHNAKMQELYPRHEDQVGALNHNVKVALVGDAQGGETYARLKRSLQAPTYNKFSNNNSTGKWYTSLEQPHDELHLAVGGQRMGSHGDMGENETASFDPVFFFHHANIDRMFWIWQKKWGKTASGSLEINPADMEGTYGQSPKGQGGTRTVPGTTKLTMDTPLHPFRLASSGEFMTSRDVVDLKNQLGMDYSAGSFAEDASKADKEDGPEIIISIMNINKANFLGSFRVNVSHKDPESGEFRPVSSVGVLSRWNLKRCKNCQIHLARDVHVDLTSLKRKCAEAEQDVSKLTYRVEFVDRSCSTKGSVAARATFAEGNWTIDIGREKIGSVHIELDEKDQSEEGSG